MNARRFIPICLLALASALAAADATHDWRNDVPTAERERANPYASAQDNAETSAAGAILFHRNCASCHGDTAQGRSSKPSLRTTRVHAATDGELHWLLTNGNLRRGMPSWSRLPDAQRWQLIRYLRTLPIDSPANAPK